MKHVSAVPTFLLLALFAASARADQFSVLGTASSFAVLAGSTVTNTGTSVISGNLGLDPGTSITGLPSGAVTNGSIYSGLGTAATAQADASGGYIDLAALAPTQVLTGQGLGGMVLGPGVYFYASSAELTGPLTLDFDGENDADIIFQIGSTLTTASGSSVSIINQGLDDNVYYQIGSSATLGTGSMLQGDIIANTSITLTTGASIGCGSAIALNGAVTLDTNTITNCSTTNSDVDPGSSPTPSPVPEPTSIWLLGTGALGAMGALRRRLSA